jgi:hypothetical protein
MKHILKITQKNWNSSSTRVRIQLLLHGFDLRNNADNDLLDLITPQLCGQISTLPAFI